MKLSIDVSTAIIGWCQDGAAQYRENDPAVGIFPNEEMAKAFDGLADLVEDMPDGEVGPVDGLRTRVAELEGIPDWLSRFYEDNGYVPYPSVIKSQFNIK